MSTKINARSPFFLETTAPAAIAKVFDCTTANLLNFSVSSSGAITEPSIREGNIIDRTVTSFAANTSGSNIARSVTYTIQIPSDYSNASDGTLTCAVSTNQLSQTPAQDPVENDNCPRSTGTIPAITGLTSSGTSVNLSSYFTAGTDATISRYEILAIGSAAISTSISGSTATFSTGSTCVSGSFRARAFNSVDLCVADSLPFSVSSACLKTLTCTTTDATNDAVNLIGGEISAAGVITRPSYSIAHLSHIEDSGNNTITSVPANNTGSPINVTLTFVFTVPAGYTNAGAELECDKLFVQQPTSAPLVNLECSDVYFDGFSITSQGNLISGTVSYLGTATSEPTNVTTEDGSFKYDVVASPTTRTLSITFRILNTKWLNYNSIKTCPLPLTQPPSQNACDFATGDFAISEQSFSAVNSFCDFNKRYSILQQVNGTPAVGNTVCYLGNTFDGGSRFFAYNTAQSQNGAGNIGTSFSVMQIDSNGTILRITTTNCQGDTGADIQY